ncbi:MAG: MarR family transcriptional regulator [Verrucomicrobia bacterium]|nr:MarR family transcriptional regulator [Verrucomicrobiota bacterium]MBI3867889.1 MarR family transcriptional regulator [Verrucomicrobiota bacterium]
MKHSGVRPGACYAAFVEVLRSSESLWNASRIFLARWDLSPSQFNLMKLLYDSPDGLTQSEVGRQLIMHRSNVTGLTDRLEARRIVTREDQAGDRRVYRLTLTQEGNELMRSVLPRYYYVAEELWSGMGKTKARQLAVEMSALAANAERLAVEEGGVAR